MKELRVQIARAATGDQEAVHATRIAIRRWFSTVKAFEDYFNDAPESQLHRVLKNVMDASSSVRDCDVAAELLARLEAGPEILSKVARRRAKRARRLSKVLQEAAAGEFASSGNPGAAAKPGANPGGEPLVHHAQEVLKSAFKDFLKRGEREVHERDSRRLHKFRIQAKELRYTLELFSSAGTGFDEWREPVRKLQSLLGDAHDCDAIREMVAKWPESKAVNARLKRRREAKLRQFRSLWRERFSRASLPAPKPPMRQSLQHRQTA